MITEDYVSFETAKLLKEKGFDERISMVYKSYGELRRLKKYDGICNSNYNDITKNYFECTAPTFQMAMKWLRETHKIIPIVLTGGDSQNPFYYWFRIDRITNGKLEDAIYREDEKEYSSYEQACEEAIKYCLENLI